jgi:hypothetical protein
MNHSSFHDVIEEEEDESEDESNIITEEILQLR